MNSFGQVMVLCTTFATTLTAGISAATEKAGWYTVFFIIAGFGVGIGISLLTTWLGYSILGYGSRQKRSFIMSVVFLFYLLLIMLVFVFAIHGTGVATAWAVRHFILTDAAR